jgi:serine phosphatase RsbU (regulator of sigma subunit)/anti-sigma regulatory factor (Ser/Thr protein kinase)
VPDPTVSVAGRLLHLQELTAGLSEAMTPDDVARATLGAALRLDGVVRAGLAVNRGAGRELDFVASDDDAVTPAGVRWCHIDGLADVPLTVAVRREQPVLVHSLAELAARFPHLVERQRGLGTRAMAAMPLRAGGRAVGALLLSFGGERTFDEDEQAFLGAVAAQVAQALRRGLAYQVEQTISERLQRSLLPESLPDIPGLQLGAYYRPGGHGVDVGGDWYDVLPLADGSVLVALGDVMGKGVPAAIVMGQVRSAVRAYALLDPDPALVLERLDELIATSATPEQIVTLALALLDPDHRRVRIAVAGHPPPVVVPERGPARLWEVPTGPPLGLRAGPWPTAEGELPSGSTLLLYSDGLVESRSVELAAGIDELLGQVGALEARRRYPREMCARLGAVVPGDVEDDVTLLAVMNAARRHVRSEVRDLPADPSSSRAARQFVGEQLAAWGLDEDVAATAQLCVTELVTNVLIHAGTPCRVTLHLDEGWLQVLVQDSGRHGVVQRADGHTPLDISGRGLALVEALTAGWSAERSADGTTVWFELEVQR